MKGPLGLLLTGVLMTTSGCASLFAGQSPLEIQVDAPPKGTTIRIDNMYGQDDRVHENLNALRTQLNPGGTYTVTVSRPGFQSETVSLSKTMSPWVYANAFPILIGTTLMIAGLAQPTQSSGSTLGAAAGDAFIRIGVVFLSFLAGTLGVSGTVGGLVADFSSGKAWHFTPNTLRFELEEEK